ncbi:uncharacterized protein E0L32_008688 [Thyridium curvatum]|uniref:Uncharacterized protein n=1 Tax=Thyridium curvatum TaxID=1093900 RepID=A0A507AR54_9PEZI|nr:uncharacterized protein E0L32_008688 [Thyridium curvatum]TPX10283.1 hypothetical protein E0L32_008688 [Thyridium curvatum]
MATANPGEIAHDLSMFPPSLRGRRILLCTESFGPVNGVSRTTLMLVNHLREHGAKVAVVAPHNSTKINTFVPVATADDGKGDSKNVGEVRVRGFPVPFNPELSIVYPLRLSTLYARTFGGAPDLIYVASPASLGFQVLLQLRQQSPPRRARPPVICNFQTDLGAYCAILLPPPLGAFASFVFARVEGFLFRHPLVSTMFYPSRFVRRYLERTGVPADKMRLLQRGVNAELFNPSRRSEALRRQIAPRGEIILVCVSRIAGEKGFDFLAAAADELDRRGLDFKLYIVGGNRRKEVEAEVHGMFAGLQRKGKVLFAGFKLGEALAESYAAGDVFLHCSVTETFGLVVLESLASGVPVVARDEGGPSDIVRHGESGFLVPPGDLQAFVDKVLVLAKDGDLRRRMSAEARRQACEATWDKINNKVAWAMADAIEAREKEVVSAPQLRDSESGGVWRSGFRVRDRLAGRIADLRVLGGMGVIIFFWALIAFYLVVIKIGMAVRSRLRL